MNYVIKSIFVTLMLTLVLKSSFGQKPIRISVDPKNDTLLILSDGGTTELGNAWNRKVYWEIADPKITSFEIISKFFGANHPFEQDPSRTPHGSRLDSRVEFNTKVVGDWYYSIIWTDNKYPYPHTYDPKIAVKPQVKFWELIFLLGFIIAAITSLVFYTKWRDAEHKLAKKDTQNT